MKKRRILGLMLALGMILGMMLGISTSVIAKDATGTIEIDSSHFSALAKNDIIKKGTTIRLIIHPHEEMTARAYINSQSNGGVSSAGKSDQESSLGFTTRQDYIVENVVCKDESPYNYELYLSSLVTGISLSSSTLSLTAGGSTATLTPTITPSEASYKSVKWSSDTPSVASVDSNGVVKPIKEGKATITATCDADNTKKASCTVTVEMSAEEKAAKEVAEKKAAADKAAASGVDEKIKAIGTVSYTDACKAKIDAARKAYDALTTDQKKLVTNYSTLTDAEKKYADLKAEADKKPSGNSGTGNTSAGSTTGETATTQTTAPTTPTTTTAPKTATEQPTSQEKITIMKAPVLKKLKSKKNKVLVSWNKIKKNKAGKKLFKQIRYIEVQAATDPAFKNIVATRNVGKKKTKATLKLARKTTYYVRVRYVGTDGVSKWSKIKKVKTK